MSYHSKDILMYFTDVLSKAVPYSLTYGRFTCCVMQCL